MKHNKSNIYIYEALIFIYLLLSLLFVVLPFKSSKYLSYIQMIIWIILLLVILFKSGFPRDNCYFKKLGIKYAIIYCFLYVIVLYIFGFFTGFSKSIYSHSLRGIFNNVFPAFIFTFCMETIRYIVCKKSNGKIKPLIFITLIYILYDLFLSINYYNLNGTEQIFIFVCMEFCSSVARNSLFTYVTYNVSLVPTLILSETLEIFWFFVPIIPNLGNYISSVLGVILPYFLYLKYKKMIKYSEKQDLAKNKNLILLFPVFVFVLTTFLLVSGIGRFHMIAIASDSMNPVYYRGDAIIYEKEDASNIEEGDILVFEYENIVVTHRVIDISKVGNKIYFKTKGDNNENPDSELISEDKVHGKVKYIVKYIGYPTVILREMFEG